jgi:uncharacterized protein with FMN-binding domain
VFVFVFVLWFAFKEDCLMRRAIVSTTATVSGIVLLLGLKSHGGTAAHAAQSFSIGTDPGASAPSASAPPSTGTSSGGTPASKAPSSAAANSGSASKVITGAATNTRYGPVQVKVTFSGKKIAKIDVIQYPTESGRDQEINSAALPILNQEAMTAQSAKIDVVSGATYTTDGYTQSLQSAIDQANA